MQRCLKQHTKINKNWIIKLLNLTLLVNDWKNFNQLKFYVFRIVCHSQKALAIISIQNNYLHAVFRCTVLKVESYRTLQVFNQKICLPFNSGLGCAHRFSERIARFCKKMSNSLIRSFLVGNLSNSLMVAHFWWATWASCSWLLIFDERPERFAYIAHFWWATWAIRSHRSPKKREWANLSLFLIKKRI